ncbi:TetR/AcrR family transcriptional regulator [Streptomyces sp. MNU76]|uniref:helix-turn-helix domain-containing protein n=1 Tax=Streptomyces sp. MNU76 TaxID=2560026 RepID=UPI001E53A932|nr:helix-turn-helix domain-containing protein [Streptomyces sp. MNU76]MCC9705478.1 TetR/AcrR family transcriptional regulator [Streptomyces sp. MNU76]
MAATDRDRDEVVGETSVVRAANELLAEGGYPAPTMDKAAARAGVGKATVYRRWRSRTELAAEDLGIPGGVTWRARGAGGTAQSRTTGAGT